MQSNPNSNGSSSTKLAPGFRFHPTDEELVSYYLKRRVLGRRIAVDAIADVDLYKHEPWDLPSMSRLQSRDVEWYFFSPLDRKYSNRSRTNRATAGGYWKTTGKDRPVRHGSHTVGMKKTLVFHSGRAPRGERTNWVMHEYRLEDEGLKLSSIPQDGFVVCRIFQKSGAGPQNGAQYGAPFVEEEWEEEEDDLANQTLDEDKLFLDAGGQEYLQMNDILQDPEAGNVPLLEADIDGEINEGRQAYINGCDEHANVPEVQGKHVADNDVGEGILTLDQSWSPSHNDGYVELNDFVETVGADQPINGKFTALPVGPCSNQSSPIDMVELGDFPEINVDEFFDILNENSDVQEAFPKSSTMQYNGNLQTYACTKSTSGNHAFAQLAEIDSVQYGEPDAPSNDLPSFGGDFVHSSNFFSPMAEACAFDKVDELMEYFDATDNNLHYVTLSPLGKVESGEPSNVTQTSATPEFVGSSIPTCDASQHAIGTDAENAAVSSATFLAISDGSGSKQEAFTDQDAQGNENCQTTVRKHLLTMLGSISSPPAFAEEFPADAVKTLSKHPASLSPSSSHVRAGMIHISSLTVTGNATNWCSQKSGDPRFLLSFGVAGKLESFQPTAKVHGGFMSMVLRGGLYICFLSTLILAAGFKIGLHICTR